MTTLRGALAAACVSAAAFSATAVAKPAALPAPILETTMIAPSGKLPMTNRHLDELFREIASDVEGGAGRWQFTLDEVVVYCITDERHDRMRIISPVARVRDLSEAALSACMEANFDRTLDGRYCIYEEKLWSAFIHPLASLTDELLRSAVEQVVNLNQTFGSSYSSGVLQFGGGK